MHTKVTGFKNHDIYTDGRVLNTKTNKWTNKRIIRKYYYVDIHEGQLRKNLRLGRLVAQHFIPNPLNLPQVNHKNGNRLNDDISNLEWMSVSDNQKHKIALQKEKGTYKTPKGQMKFDRKKIDKVWSLRKNGLAHRKIASKLKMGVSTVTHILLGNRRSKQ